MNTLTPQRPTIRCQNCPASFAGSRPDLGMTVASQARTTGWIVWSGTTMGGRDETRTYCPRRSGHTPPPDEDDDGPGWDAVCETCGTRATEEWGDEAPLSEDDADAWRVDHRCEPDVRLVRPEDALR